MLKSGKMALKSTLSESAFATTAGLAGVCLWMKDRKAMELSLPRCHAGFPSLGRAAAVRWTCLCSRELVCAL